MTTDLPQPTPPAAVPSPRKGLTLAYIEQELSKPMLTIERAIHLRLAYAFLKDHYAKQEQR